MKTEIPKKIHYCWFGGNPLPELAKKCIESWKKYCPDYEIIEWNESNFDINSNTYVKEAYQAKKWAFVTDYVRLWVIYNYGGIYFDTDVELIKNIDETIQYEAFFASEDNIHISTGLGFGAKEKSEIVKNLMDDYKNISFIKPNGEFDETTCPVRNTKVIKKYINKNINFTEKKLYDNICFFSKEYFCPKDFKTGEVNIKDNTVAIHHFSGSWLSEEEQEYLQIVKEINNKYNRLIASVIIKMIGVRNKIERVFKKRKKYEE